MTSCIPLHPVFPYSGDVGTRPYPICHAPYISLHHVFPYLGDVGTRYDYFGFPMEAKVIIFEVEIITSPNSRLRSARCARGGCGLLVSSLPLAEITHDPRHEKAIHIRGSYRRNAAMNNMLLIVMTGEARFSNMICCPVEIQSC